LLSRIAMHSIRKPQKPLHPGVNYGTEENTIARMTSRPGIVRPLPNSISGHAGTAKLTRNNMPFMPVDPAVAAR
jgi:hypothetical protein